MGMGRIPGRRCGRGIWRSCLPESEVLVVGFWFRRRESPHRLPAKVDCDYWRHFLNPARAQKRRQDRRTPYSEKSLRPKRRAWATGLLGAEGAQRVDLGGAAGREVARGERGGGEDCGYGEEGCGVVGGDAEEETFHGAGEGEGGGYADDYADEREAHALAEDHTDDFGGTRADGHAHADFVGALADREGHHSADACRG